MRIKAICVLVMGLVLACAPAALAQGQVLHQVLEAPAQQPSADFAGMSFTQLTPVQIEEMKEIYGVPCGVRVSSVAGGTAAARTGVRAGDIMAAFQPPGGNRYLPIRPDIENLAELAEELKAGDIKHLVLFRWEGDAYRRIEANLAAPTPGVEGAAAQMERFGQPTLVVDQVQPGMVLQPAEPARPADTGPSELGSEFGTLRQALDTERKENGYSCSHSGECKSDYCADGKRCAPKDGTGGPGAYCHHDNHCAPRLSCLCTSFLNKSGFCYDWESWPEGGPLRDGNGRLRRGICYEPAVNGTTCYRDAQCRSGNCADPPYHTLTNEVKLADGRCAPWKETGKLGDYCHNDRQCETANCTCPPGVDKKGGYCPPWPESNLSDDQVRIARAQGFFTCGGPAYLGERCTRDAGCKSGYCANGKFCAPRDGTGDVGDYCHHENHCKKELWCDCGAFGYLDAVGFCPAWKSGGGSTHCKKPQKSGEECFRADQCESGYCANVGSVKRAVAKYPESGRCAPKDGTGQEGEYCHHDNHCDTGHCYCPSVHDGRFCKNWENYSTAEIRRIQGTGLFMCMGLLDLGDDCTGNDQCKSEYCANGQRCAPEDGTGKPGEYCHHNNHCRSGVCNCPLGKSFGFCANWEARKNRGTCQ